MDYFQWFMLLVMILVMIMSGKGGFKYGYKHPIHSVSGSNDSQYSNSADDSKNPDAKATKKD